MKTMSNNDVTTENKILKAANTVFLLYGYHGTTIHQIAKHAGVQKSAIHYYYRSKEKLYSKVIKFILEDILKNGIHFNAPIKISAKQKWFLYTELYNNKICFEKTLKELYLNDWDKKQNEIKKLCKI